MGGTDHARSGVRLLRARPGGAAAEPEGGDRRPAERTARPGAAAAEAGRTRKRVPPFLFLFVGTLGYYPNEEGINGFCTEVAPVIRRLSDRPFRVVIVGVGAGPALLGLTALPEVELVGAVPSVEPWYAEADAVVVPIRAGGGTRIKALEAFALGRPVVATPIGIEGIDAADGEHVLIGATAAELAARCVRLMDDPALAARLVAQARALFTRAYSTAAAARTIAAVSPPLLHQA